MYSKAPLADCEHCPLKDQPCVKGYNPNGVPEDVSLVIVGEVPGFQEVKQGFPFVDPSGDLLRSVLEYHKIDPNNVYYTNAVLCRPPNNEIEKYPNALYACQKRLHAELDQYPDVPIVALGNTALEALCGVTGITSERGMWHSKLELKDLEDDLPF